MKLLCTISESTCNLCDIIFFSDSSVSCHSCNYSSGRTWQPSSKPLWYTCCKRAPHTCSFSVFCSGRDFTQPPHEPHSAYGTELPCPPHAGSQPSSYNRGFFGLALPNNSAKYVGCYDTIACCGSAGSAGVATASRGAPAPPAADVPDHLPADHSERSALSPSHAEHASSIPAAAASTSSVASAKHNSSFRTDSACAWGWSPGNPPGVGLCRYWTVGWLLNAGVPGARSVVNTQWGVSGFFFLALKMFC